MKVSELANAAGVNADTVRFYTREGLLHPTRDPANGYQVYDANDLQRLRFARKARQLGFGLKDIKAILGAADDHHSPCPMVRRLFEEKLAEVDAHLAELQALRTRMQSAMEQWTRMPDGTPDGHTVCRLIEHWDQDEELQHDRT